ncbi:Formate-dependent nitrite reductase complex subunit NrfG, partial [Haemophilus influenzae]
EKGQNP